MIIFKLNYLIPAVARCFVILQNISCFLQQPYNSCPQHIKKPFFNKEIEEIVPQKVLESRELLIENFSLEKSSACIIISPALQKLYLIEIDSVEVFPISTATKGIGTVMGSFMTPYGAHEIFKKIGYDQKLGTIFQSRVPTGNIYSNEYINNSSSDLVTTRIMWLNGLENGVNKGINNNNEIVDSKSRYIYIHGTADENNIGKPISRGCIR